MSVNSEQIFTQLMKWAVQMGLKVEPMLETKHDFVLVIYENDSLPRVQIIHQRRDAAFVLLVGLINIPENDRTKLKNFDQKRFDELVWRIKLNLLLMDVEFIVLGSERDPDSWEIQKRLSLEEANMSSLYQGYSKVKHALISIIWSFRSAVESTE